MDRGGFIDDPLVLRLLRHLPDYVALIDRERRFQWANRLAPGLTWEQVEGTAVEQWVAPPDQQTAIDAIERCFSTGEPCSYDLFAYGDGEVAFFYENRVVLAPLEGGAQYALVLTRDITQSVRDAQRIQDGERRLRRAADAAGLGLWEYDLRSCAITRQADWLPVSLGAGESADAASFLEKVHAEDRDRVHRWFDALVNGTAVADEVDFRMDEPGGPRWFINRARRQTTEDGRELITGVLLDITDLRHAEEQRASLQQQLSRAQRWESIGHVTSGIAHDFNNLLMVLQASLDTLKVEVPAEHAAEFRNAEHVIDRASQLTRKLLALGRRAPLQIRALDLGELVRQVTALARRVLSPSVRLQCFVPDDPVFVMGDAAELEQVLLNLCINARDAMPKGGSLSLTLEVREGQAHVTVEDTGCGIAPEILGRMFEPFYTTKAVGEGSGLGLAVARGTIEQHKGRMDAASELGIGTRVFFALPLSDRPVESDHRDEAAPEAVPGARLLLADDEPSILRALERTLARAGYEVVTAVDGQDALDKWSVEPERFDAVILDAVMPRVDGWVTYLTMLEVNPGVRVLFTSGHLLTLRRPGDGPTPPVLAKPFATRQLLQAVARLLTSRDGHVDTPRSEAPSSPSR